jgi:hypothetical protein
MQQHLHIISFDVPFPANYGGVIDIYFKIKALHEQGIKIHLHCYKYGRQEAKELESICEKVYYYQRKIKKSYLLKSLPFIVVTRNSLVLIKNLLQDNHPILFEGLHTCFYLNDERLKNRIKIVRTHNIEHEYYQGLYEVEKSPFKKLYFKQEAKKLKKFEAVLHDANYIMAISKADKEALSERYKNVFYVGAFNAYDNVNIKEGIGEYCLYHGNLAVGENNKAALYLVKEIFSEIKTPLIIAGNNPTKELTRRIENYAHIQLRENVDEKTMSELIQNAQIHILPAFQSTGIKLKLIAALFNGRHCIVNDTMISNTGFEKLCSVKNTASEIIKEVERLFELPFNMEEKEKREKVLLNYFSNRTNAEKIIEKITNKPTSKT